MNELFTAVTSLGQWYRLRAADTLLNGEERRAKLEEMIEEAVRQGDKADAFQAAKFLGRNLTVEEVAEVIKNAIAKGNYYYTSYLCDMILRREPTEDELEQALAAVLRKQPFWVAQNFARELRRGLTPDEIAVALESAIERFDIEDIRDIFLLQERKIDEKIADKILGSAFILLEKNKFLSSIELEEMKELFLDLCIPETASKWALKFAEYGCLLLSDLIPPETFREACEKVLVHHLRHSTFEKCNKFAQELLARELTDEELARFILANTSDKDNDRRREEAKNAVYMLLSRHKKEE
jgi:hypothetical protein